MLNLTEFQATYEEQLRKYAIEKSKQIVSLIHKGYCIHALRANSIDCEKCLDILNNRSSQ